MGLDGWLTLAVVGMVVGLLAFTRLSPDLTLLSALAVLLLAGVLDPGEALSGFANEAVATIALLFVVAAGVVETGGITWIAERIFGRPRSLPGATLRLMLPTSLLSSVLNNTPVVAMLIPAVNDWAKQQRLPVSKLMIPLSYAAILGGTCTLIGTSTNLLVNGMLISAADAQQAAGGAMTLPRGLGMFDITWVGLPCTVAGIAFMVIFGRWLLPDRQPSLAAAADTRQYTVEMSVEPGSPLVGKSIEQAGLRHLPGLYLAEIERDGVVLPAVSPEERLRSNDRLVFVGAVDSVVDLQRIRGLVPARDQVFKLDAPRPERCLIEAVASPRCPIVGKTIRDGRFRSRYNAVVIAVSREGQRLKGKIGDIVLQAGDTLLLEAHPSFVEQHRNSRDFFLVSPLQNSRLPKYERAPLALAIVVGMVAIVSCSELLGPVSVAIGAWRLNFGQITMFKGALVAAAMMLLTRCCRVEDARRNLDWQVLLAIAAALGVEHALAKTGVAAMFARYVIDMAQGSPLWSLAAIYGVSLIVTELVTNSAAAALMFPFALATANSLGVNPMPFVIVVMLSASAAFATPMGYQTNLMVYGPGGYRFQDYLRVGVLMNLLIWAVGVIVIPLVWKF